MYFNEFMSILCILFEAHLYVLLGKSNKKYSEQKMCSIHAFFLDFSHKVFICGQMHNIGSVGMK